MIKRETADASEETMSAAVLIAPGRLEMRRVPRPTPAPDEVRVRVESCGVCASNLPVWAGQPWFTYPLAPGALGHEATGRIDALGEKVDAFHLGQRVTMLSEKAYAEYDVAPAANVLPLPAKLDGIDVPGEPLGCAMNIFLRAAITRDATVAVVGVGFLGALLIQLARRAGARVIALARRGWALELARSLGAEEVLSLQDFHGAIARVRELTTGCFCDVTIEATGKQTPLDLAAEITRERGRLVIAGYHQDGPRQINLQLWNWRGLDVINAHERDPAIYVAGIRRAVAALAAGELAIAPLITHRLPLRELGAALDLTRDRPAGFMKALVFP